MYATICNIKKIDDWVVKHIRTKCIEKNIL